MSRLNAPRTVPYDFRVFELDDVAWLFDDSTRTYICSATPMIWAEPLYTMSADDEAANDVELPDPSYFSAARVEKLEHHKIRGHWPSHVDEETAWDEARESANANHVI